MIEKLCIECQDKCNKPFMPEGGYIDLCDKCSPELAVDFMLYKRRDIMTTPQNQLYYLADRIKDLYEMFKGDNEESDIFGRVKEIELQMQDIIAAQHRQENLMNVIIKLLSK